MPLAHILLALLVILIWGINFVFVKFALDALSPYTLCALRFVMVSVPAVFFIKRPPVSIKLIALYGTTMFGLQFCLLFIGIHAGVSPGLASLVMQVQVFFTMFYAAMLWHEKPSRWQLSGAIISFTGIGLVAMHLDAHVTWKGLIFVLLSAASWGWGNVISKSIGKVNMVGLVVWGSFVISLPMILVSLYFDGYQNMLTSYQHLNWLTIISILYVVYISTWVGYTVWSWLLSHHPVSSVSPFTLLVPIVGMLSSTLVLDESFQLWKLGASVLVIGGLVVNIIGTRYFAKYTAKGQRTGLPKSVLELKTD